MMSTRQAKLIRKQIRKKNAEIKTQGLIEFIEFVNKRSFIKRFKFAMRIIFRWKRFITQATQQIIRFNYGVYINASD